MNRVRRNWLQHQTKTLHSQTIDFKCHIPSSFQTTHQMILIRKSSIPASHEKLQPKYSSVYIP
ncbi:hypothetical protein CDL12_10630 [Handroanthus impetiginosus]|uniref:Uncharacterized protein n=1 Tax=Handroanthus impetiginosus TaxID=429701 RepID=A0A2G9HGU6_9LAMI|nr:hypothetical protein CDL12_10630 [Handroanthus impetiginosus]